MVRLSQIAEYEWMDHIADDIFCYMDLDIAWIDLWQQSLRMDKWNC